MAGAGELASDFVPAHAPGLLEERIAARLGAIAHGVVPRLVLRIVAYEVALLCAALGVRGVRAEVTGEDRAFAYGSESPLRMLLYAYPLLAIGDELVVMVCVPPRFVALHVIAAAIGVYGLVWLLGVVRGSTARPHIVGRTSAQLHRSVLGSTTVSRSDVVRVVPIDAEAIAKMRGDVTRLDVGGERALVILRAGAEQRSAVRCGVSRAIVVSVDDLAGFCEAMRPS